MSDPAKKDGENLLNIREEDGPEGAKGMAEVCERTNMMTITESNQNLTNVNIPVYQTETPLGDETTPHPSYSSHKESRNRLHIQRHRHHERNDDPRHGHPRETPANPQQ